VWTAAKIACSTTVKATHQQSRAGVPVCAGCGVWAVSVPHRHAGARRRPGWTLQLASGVRIVRSHVADEDAEAYASWAGKSLPAEAEWERAARGGLERAACVWGDQPERPRQRLANYRHGAFPRRPHHGYGARTPVGSYPANGYGLHDMAGNVWEWTSDWYRGHHPDDADHPCCVPVNPRGGVRESSHDPGQPQFPIPRKVIKGGSYLCADEYRLRYRPAARRPQMIDTGMSHLGFRCMDRGSPALDNQH